MCYSIVVKDVTTGVNCLGLNPSIITYQLFVIHGHDTNLKYSFLLFKMGMKIEMNWQDHCVSSMV